MAAHLFSQSYDNAWVLGCIGGGHHLSLWPHRLVRGTPQVAHRRGCFAGASNGLALGFGHLRFHSEQAQPMALQRMGLASEPASSQRETSSWSHTDRLSFAMVQACVGWPPP